jgi:hypothetical protein
MLRPNSFELQWSRPGFRNPMRQRGRLTGNASGTQIQVAQLQNERVGLRATYDPRHKEFLP